ncbi:MAG TPA: zinc metalloprotease [Solirubrobacteraceae bacterium]|nr:zinc metalloprotease [Solirubrobacteraceae bacterium]
MRNPLTGGRPYAIAATVATAAALAVTPGTAAAATAPSAADALACAPSGQSGLMSRVWSSGSTARGSKEKDTRAFAASSEIPAGQEPATSESFTATIPVWFHVIAASRSPRDGWVSDDQIARQMDVLNRAFAGGYGGADTGFRFRLAGVTRTINAEWFAMETFAAEAEAKRALRRGDATTLNIYSSTAADFLGWAYYPSIVAGNFEYLDGAVIDFDSMPGGKIRNFNLGHTATHEVGHWLGLAHTFEQGCVGHGDHVDDTPAERTPTSGCPAGKDTCPEPGEDPIHNYMDYSYDACYQEFTTGQALRGQEQYLFWRVKHGY